MNASNIAFSSPTQPHPDQGAAFGTPLHGTFALRAAQVDRLIDEKIGYIMESARLLSLAKASPEQREGSLVLIQDLAAKISCLQEQIDREMKGLFYSLQKAPAPSPFLDELQRPFQTRFRYSSEYPFGLNLAANVFLNGSSRR